MLIIDAHEDIAWNALTFGRDYTRSALWIREQERGTVAPDVSGSATLGRPEWLLGHVGVAFATLFLSPMRKKLGEWDTQCYRDAPEAYRLASAQLDYYSRLADEHDQFLLIGNGADLEEVVATWKPDATLAQRRIGLLPLMEGAEPVLEPAQVEEWFERGVRIIGPAWEATRYAGGTHEPGPLTTEGFGLLESMASFGMILDLSHLDEQAYFQAVERYEGVVIASHSNPRHFVPTSRGLSDEMLRALAERDGVVGIVLYNAFLKADWQRGDRKEKVTLANVVDAIDHVCQVTGSAAHVGIGSDLDGGFGVEHTPVEIDTVADLLKLTEALAERGFTPEQIEGILGGNWLRVLRVALPD